MVLCIGIEQPADHALVLCMMFLRLALEELDASLAQRNGDLDAFVPKYQFFGPGKEIRNDPEVSEGFVGVFDFLAHRCACLSASSKHQLRCVSCAIGCMPVLASLGPSCSNRPFKQHALQC